MAFENLMGMLPCCGCSAFFLLFGGTLGWYGLQKYRLAQKIANTPTSKIRSAAAGLVEIFGKAKIKDALESPITKAKCSYYYVRAEYYKKEKNRGEWHTFWVKSDSRPFLLEDETGSILLDSTGGDISISSIFHTSGHMSGKALFGMVDQKTLDPQVMAYLEANPDVKSKFESMGGRSLRVHEYAIREGDPLYVIGRAEPATDGLIMRMGDDKIFYINEKPEKSFLSGLQTSSTIYLALGGALLIAALASMAFALLSAL